MEDRGLPTCRCGRIDWFNDGLVIVADERRRLRVERVDEGAGFRPYDRWSCMTCASEVVPGSRLHRDLDRMLERADSESTEQLDLVS
jgi:hypothetical protein